MKNEQAKQKALLAIHTIITAAKELAEAETDYLTSGEFQVRQKDKQEKKKCTT